MKYSIFGFRQDLLVEQERKIIVSGKEKVLKVDVIDLLILQDVSDFMNRKNIIKYTIDSQDFFSIRYDTLIEDLPILNIKKQALADRINKLCLFGLLEKKTIKNELGSWTAFRIGENYERLKYSDSGGGCVSKQGGAYQNTDGVRSKIQTGCVSNYTPKDSTTIKDSSTIKDKEDTNVSDIYGNEGESLGKSVKKTLQERQYDFGLSLAPYLQENGGKYTREMIREFYDYWSEPNQAQTKMRWEMQKTWEVGRRLATWANNNKNFKNNYGRETATDRLRRTFDEANEFRSRIAAQREADLETGDYQ